MGRNRVERIRRSERRRTESRPVRLRLKVTRSVAWPKQSRAREGLGANYGRIQRGGAANRSLTVAALGFVASGSELQN